jgi:hypothetical protein
MIRKSIGTWIPSQDMTETVQFGGLLAGAQTPSNPCLAVGYEWELVTAKLSKGPAWHGDGCLRAE